MPAVETYSRHYLSRDFKASGWADLEPVINELLARPLPTASDLEQWLLDISEFEAVVDEESSRRWIAKDVNTADKAAKARFFDWLDSVAPKLTPAFFKLSKRFAEHPAAGQLDASEFACYLKRTRNEIEIFRDENVPLSTAESKIVTEYESITGNQTVKYDGEERTMPQMQKFLESQDRKVREASFRASTSRRERDFPALEDIFDRLLTLRSQMAKNVGFKSYRELAWRRRERFDYQPSDCIRFNEAIERVCVPRMKRLQDARARQLGLKSLRPWDLAVDPTGGAPLDPFKNSGDLIRKARKAFDLVDPALARHFDILIDNKLLDLDSRKAKSPGGYQSTLQERRMPFIFMNAAGLQRDVETLLHEGGHAFHAVEQRPLRLTANRNAPLEFAEVASMSMELLAGTYLGKTFYSEADAVRARIQHLEGIINFFPHMATIDGFQQWIYTNPGHTREQRAAAWLDLRKRYAGNVDWSGFENANRYRWTQQLHIFGMPFYYVEYGIAQLGALQIWRNYLNNPKRAIEQYRYALSLGNTRPLPQLFEAAGAKFDFSSRMLEELLSLVDEHLAKLKAQVGDGAPRAGTRASIAKAKPAKKAVKAATRKPSNASKGKPKKSLKKPARKAKAKPAKAKARNTNSKRKGR